MKIRTVGGELFHGDKRTERQTDMTKLFAILQRRLKTRQFINIPKFLLDNVKQQWIRWYKLRCDGKVTRFFGSARQGRQCVHLEQFSIPLFLSPIVSKVQRTMHVVLKVSVCKPECFQLTWIFQSRQRTVVEADMPVNREECIIGANFSYVRKYHVKEEVIYFLNEMKWVSTFKSERWNAVMKFRERWFFLYP